jgi:predicted transcriptional regulator
VTSEIQLPDEEWLIEHLNKVIYENRISQEELVNILGVSTQSAVSRILNQESRLTYQEAYKLTVYLLKYASPLPKKPVSEYSRKSDEVSFVYSDEPISEAIRKLEEGYFTQLLVKDREKGTCLGIVTDLTLLKRMAQPLKSTSKDKWLTEFKTLTIENADVIEQVPQYPEDCSIIEVAEGLKNHYAVLVEEGSEYKIGIITRADLLKII